MGPDVAEGAQALDGEGGAAVGHLEAVEGPADQVGPGAEPDQAPPGLGAELRAHLRVRGQPAPFRAAARFGGRRR
ncbi:MAG: hypothetical protein ACJ75N_05780 [Actinomycetes bacterium]